ncbi:MAG: heavy metal-binding domain-containing protein [Clostridia bacterium]
MPFWNRNRPPSRSPNTPRPDPARQQASIEALEAGNLPLEAQDRLRRQAGHELAWTSTLTTSEFLQARALGLTPLGQVMGSSTMHPAFNAQWLYGVWQNGDIRPLTRALTDARDHALERLRMEADALHAHGVVGVILKVHRPEWGSGLLEFTAMGTAVSLGDVPIPNQIFLGTLSALDTAKLVHAGYIPMDLAFATTAYYVMTTWGAEWSEMSWSNQEIPDFSRAIYEARDYVVAGMREQARHVGADGVLGAEWTMEIEEIEVDRPAVGNYGMGGYGMGMGQSSHRDHIIHLTVTGTAVGKLSAAGAARPHVLPILSLKDAPEGVKQL